MATYLAVIWTLQARQDLIAIRDYIAADSPCAAVRFSDRLQAAANRLSDFPEVGRAVGRSRILATVPPYLIRYRIRPEGVIVLGIRHGRRS